MGKNILIRLFKNIGRNKTCNYLNIAGLAIGLTGFMLIIMWVKFESGYDRFNDNSGRIFRIENDRIYSDRCDKSAGCPPALAPTLKADFPEIIESARLRGTDAIFIDEMRKISDNQVKIYYADPSLLNIFTLTFLKGTKESVLKNPYSVIISKSFAQKYFGKEDPIGKSIKLANEAGKNNHTITGIFKDRPQNSHVKFDILISYETLISQNKDAKYYWGWNGFNTYILLAPNADPKALAAKFPAMIEKYKNYEPGYKREYLLQPVTDIHLHSNLRMEPEVNGSANTVKFLTIIAVFILILAWVNYINLSTGNSFTRAKEVGVRKVLGSGKLQLVRQFMVESFLLNGIALVFALIIVEITLPYFRNFTGKPLSLSLLADDWAMWIFVFIGGTFLSGVYPAFVLSSFNPVTIFRTNLLHGAKGIDIRKALVVFQFVVSIVLIAATLFVYKQLIFMKNENLGVNFNQVVVLKAPIADKNAFQSATALKNQLNTLPGVKGITFSATVPGKDYSNASSGVHKFGSSPIEGRQGLFADVDENYLGLFEIPLVAGRNFTNRSGLNEEIIINEEAVKEYGFTNPEDAVGKRLVFDGFNGQSILIVGVAKNYHQVSLKNSLQPVIFNPVNEANANVKYFSVKVNTQNLTQTIERIHTIWDKIYVNQPFEFDFLDDVFNAQYSSEQQFGMIFGLFTFLAIFVSCLGLFGLLYISNHQRTKEIGIRKVNGATISKVMIMLNRDFVKWVVIAFIIATPVAWLVIHKWLEGFAYKTELSWWIFALAGLLALVIAILTVSWQSWRAATCNPVEALKNE
jgi:putative ABC transport system permease protein